MQKLLCRSSLITICLGLFAAPVFFGAVHIWSATWIHALAFLLLLSSAAFIFLGTKEARGAWVDFCVFLFLVIVCIGYLRSPSPFQSRQEFLNLLASGALYLAVRLQLHRTWHLEVVFATIFCTASLIAFYAVIQHFSGSTAVLWKDQYPNPLHRSSGTYICPNHFAGLVDLAAPLVLSVALWGRPNPGYRLLLGYGFFVMIAGIVFSYSRGGLLALMGGLTIVLILGIRKKLIGILTILLLGGLVTGGFFYYLHQFNPDQLARFLGAIQHGEVSRPQIWKSAWHIFLDNPLFGVGPMMFDGWHAHYRNTLLARAVYVHNDYLQLLTDYGIVGASVMLILVVFLVYRIWLGIQKYKILRNNAYYYPAALPQRTAFQRAFFIGAIGSWVSVLCHLVVDFDMHILANALILSTILAFVVSLSFRPEDLENQPEWPPKLRWSMVIGLVSIPLLLLPVTYRNFKGEYWRLKAKRANEVLQWESAERFLQEAVQADPSSSQAWEDYVDFLYQKVQLNVLQREKWANDFFKATESAWKTNPLNYSIRVRRGEVYDLLGRYDEAEKEYEMAIQFDPNNPYFQTRFGLHHQKRGNIEKAMSHFRKALELNASDPIALQNIKES